MGASIGTFSSSYSQRNCFLSYAQPRTSNMLPCVRLVPIRRICTLFRGMNLPLDHSLLLTPTCLRAFSVLNRPPPSYDGHVPLTRTERGALAGPATRRYVSTSFPPRCLVSAAVRKSFNNCGRVRSTKISNIVSFGNRLHTTTASFRSIVEF